MPGTFPKFGMVDYKMPKTVLSVEDLDDSFGEVFAVINGRLTDENVRAVPAKAIAWFSEVMRLDGAPPSWTGHVHDGVSARRLAAGCVGQDDVSYDGALGVLIHPEGATCPSPHSPFVALDPLLSGTIAGTDPGPIYLLSGSFSLGPDDEGQVSSDSTYDQFNSSGQRVVLATVPFDLSELSGHLVDPVVVATIRAEMKANTLPDREIPNVSVTAAPNERFGGLWVQSAELFPYYGEETADEVLPAEARPFGYYLRFVLILPGPLHTISQGVSLWWVHWHLLARLMPSRTMEYTNGAGDGF